MNYQLPLFATAMFLLAFVPAFCQQPESIKPSIPDGDAQIHVLDSTNFNLYRVGDFYISGQPDDSTFLALRDKGLELVVNIRTPEEMEELRQDGFDEEAFLDSLDIEYVQVPIGGSYGFTPQAIANIDEAIQGHSGPVMIHCRGAGRATNAFMAWLVNYRDVPLDEAFTLGRQMQLRLIIEDLLGYELSISRKAP
jgi:protein tyrosine phosphatase (PTP) superfamily phosphohydrolase (DUF442 family)